MKLTPPSAVCAIARATGPWPMQGTPREALSALGAGRGTRRLMDRGEAKVGRVRVGARAGLWFEYHLEG